MAAFRSSTSSRPLGRLVLGISIAASAALIVAQTAEPMRGGLEPVRGAVADALVGAALLNPLSRVSSASRDQARIAELELEVEQLSRYKALAIALAERAEAYEQSLNLIGEPDRALEETASAGVTVRVASETGGPFFDTLLAAAGDRQGVAPGDIAVNEGGLVGRVITTGGQSSRILRVTDFNSRVPGFGEQSGLRALVAGGRDGRGVIAARPERGSFVEGERLLTTGEGGLFPRGIVIGTVRAGRGDDPSVEFASDSGRAGFVRLLKPPLIEPPAGAPDQFAMPASAGGAGQSAPATAQNTASAPEG